MTNSDTHTPTLLHELKTITNKDTSVPKSGDLKIFALNSYIKTLKLQVLNFLFE